MKKIWVSAGFAVFLTVMSASTGHAEILKAYNAGDKLGRGVLNVVSSPIEVARTINVQSRVKGPGYGWTGGLAEGLGRMLGRIGTGLIDVVTFPFNFPDEHKAPLLEPEYPWQKWDVEYL